METIKFSKKLIYAFALLLVVFTGCKKDDEEDPTPGQDPNNPTENTLTASAGKDTTVQVGTLLTLDGGASKDSKGQAFNYQWVILTKPSASNAKFVDAATQKPSITPDEVGDYEVELTISNDKHQHKDRLKVHAIAATPLTIDEGIEVNTILEDRIVNPNLPDYIVTRDVAVTAELTIKPGVVIAFERNVRFSIERDAIIIAQGTADKKIKFVGKENTSGYWRGIIIYSISNANIIEHAEISNTGSTFMLSGKKSALTVFGYEAQIALKNTAIFENDGYGMFVSDGGIIKEFVANTFRKNKEAGIVLPAENVGVLDYESSFTGENGRDVVEVMSTYIKDANDEEIVWAGFSDKTPYLMTTDVSVKTGWKLNPGVTLKMAREVRLSIDSDGYIIAEGTADNKVVITGANQTPGYWRGLIVYSTSPMNSIKNAVISYSGSNAIVSGKKANIAVYGSNAYLSIKDSEIKGSSGYGVYVSYAAKINDDAETANNFTDNTEGAILKD